MKRKDSLRSAQRKGSATARSRAVRSSAAHVRSAEPSSDPASMTFAEQMRDFLRRNSTWFLVAGLIFLVLQDVFGTHGVLAMRRSQQQAVEIQKEIQQLNAENQQLQDHVKALKTDPSTIERIAREEMGLARPGEYIFKIQPKPGEPSKPLAQPAEPPRKP